MGAVAFYNYYDIILYMDDDALVSKKYFRLAKMAHTKANDVVGKQKLCAILLKGGRVIATANNNYTHERHAEVAVMGKPWSSEVEGCTLVVIRRRKTQQFGCSLPCPDCINAIRQNKIKRVIYSTNDIKEPLKVLDIDSFTELDRPRLSQIECCS